MQIDQHAELLHLLLILRINVRYILTLLLLVPIKLIRQSLLVLLEAAIGAREQEDFIFDLFEVRIVGLVAFEVLTRLIVNLLDVLSGHVLSLHDLLQALVGLPVFYPQDLRAVVGGALDLGQRLVGFGSTLLLVTAS